MDIGSPKLLTMAIQGENRENENVHQWLSSIKAEEIDDIETNDETGTSSRPSVCSDELDKVEARIKEEILDINEDEYRLMGEDTEDSALAAENEEFIADNEELIIEDEIIAENEVLAKDDAVDANRQILNISSNSKAKFPYGNELEPRSGRQPYSRNTFSGIRQSTNNCCIDLQRGIITLENDYCNKLGQNQKENEQETCCIIFDDEGNEKIVPVLQFEDLDDQKGYSSLAQCFHSRLTRFSEYARLGWKESKVPRRSDYATGIEVEVQDSTPSTSRSKKITNDIKRYQCDKCERSCVSWANLRKHMKRHDTGKRYSCPQCEYMCPEKSALIAHIKRHLGVKPHLCSHCDYKTDNISNLERHLRIHNGEKPICCPECKFRCADTSSLRIHVKRKHTYEKPYKCHRCDYRSIDKVGMVRHLMMHYGERPFRCFFCNFRSIRFDKLLAHLKRYDGTLMVCRFCNFKSSKSDEFNHHLKSNHRESWITSTTLSDGENETLESIAIPTQTETEFII